MCKTQSCFISLIFLNLDTRTTIYYWIFMAHAVAPIVVRTSFASGDVHERVDFLADTRVVRSLGYPRRQRHCSSSSSGCSASSESEYDINGSKNAGVSYRNVWLLLFGNFGRHQLGVTASRNCGGPMYKLTAKTVRRTHVITHPTSHITALKYA